MSGRSARLGTVALVAAAVVVAIGVVLVLRRSDDSGGRPPLAVTTGTPVAFVGDSYTQGTGASSLPQRWSTLVAAHFGWHELNFGVGGSGFLNPGPAGNNTYLQRVPAVAATAPGIVIVSGGINDLEAATSHPSAETGAIDDLFRRLRAALPRVQIYAVRPFFPAVDPPAEVAAIATAVRAAVTAVDGRYLDIGSPLHGHPELVASDHLHPNDAGHRALATAVDRALAAAGVS